MPPGHRLEAGALIVIFVLTAWAAGTVQASAPATDPPTAAVEGTPKPEAPAVSTPPPKPLISIVPRPVKVFVSEIALPPQKPQQAQPAIRPAKPLEIVLPTTKKPLQAQPAILPTKVLVIVPPA